MRATPKFLAVIWLIVSFASIVAHAAPSEDTRRIRSFLEGLDAGDVPIIGGRRLNEPELIASFYRSRNNAPVWLSGAPLAREAGNLLAAIGESVSHGFVAERYHRSVIENLLQSRNDASRLAVEVLLTDAFLSQALHRGRGSVFPPNIDAEWQVPQADVDARFLLAETVRNRGSVIQALEGLWPADPEYARLLARRAEILSTGDEVTTEIPPGPLLKPGQSGERIRMLKERLMGPGDYSAEYDDDLRREVVAFQRSAGLEPDGIVGANTLEMLNATKVSWIDRIDANLERWRWLPRETPRKYIRVNIAAFTLRGMEDGRPTLAMNVIVGQPYRRTPVFSETLKYMVFNPYWNVPFSIATKDKLPLLRVNAEAEAAKGYEAKPHGSDVFVPVDRIDWQNVNARNFNYLLRQRPGPQNALGKVKFMMPNPFSVYLHDTPSRELFGKQERTFSSGCIRLERPLDLADWLLAGDKHPDANKYRSSLAKGETYTIYLKKPVPTYLVYFTAFSLDDGEVTFRRDVYGRDKVLIEALRAQRQ